MNENYAQLFNEVHIKYEEGNYSQALQGLRELASEITDPWDKAELLYNEVIFLVVMQKIPEARQRVVGLNKAVASLVELPSDGYEYDFRTSLPVMALHAELRVATEEGKTLEALQLSDDLVSRYPKQLSIPEFRTVSIEVKILRGMLLGDAGRWEEAKTFLESASPPQSWKGTHTFYLGQCYYELGMYARAKEKLVEAFNFNLSGSWESQAHYILGLTEYNLSDVQAAKHQFELCAKCADRKCIDMAKLWAWLEATSKALGQFDEADNYHKLMIDSMPKKVN